MADEPENLTLKLLREMRAEQECLATMLGKVTDAVTAIATTQIIIPNPDAAFRAARKDS